MDTQVHIIPIIVTHLCHTGRGMSIKRAMSTGNVGKVECIMQRSYIQVRETSPSVFEMIKATESEKPEECFFLIGYCGWDDGFTNVDWRSFLPSDVAIFFDGMVSTHLQWKDINLTSCGFEAPSVNALKEALSRTGTVCYKK